MIQFNLSFLLSYILMAALALIVLGYSLLILIVIAWTIKNLFFWIRSGARAHIDHIDLKKAFERSLAFNDILGLGFVFSGYALLTLVPDGNTRRAAALVVACLFPYTLGFYRSAGIGIHCGVIGTIAGLTLLQGFPKFLPENTAQIFSFLLTILIANTSGWVGGAIGQGQTKDSQAIMIFNVNVNDYGHSLEDLICTVCNTVDRTVVEKFPEEKIKRKDTPCVLSVAEIGTEATNQNAILKYERKFTWQLTYAPIFEIIKDLFSPMQYNIDTVLDYVSNTMRHLVIEFDIRSKLENSLDPGPFHLAIITYMETPSITWVNHKVASLARDLYQEVMETLKDGESRPGIHRSYELRSNGFTIIREWQKQAKLEQHVKSSPGSQEVLYYVKQIELARHVKFGVDVLREFTGLPTFFDKMRGNVIIFFLFLTSQLGLGLLINWLYDQFKRMQ